MAFQWPVPGNLVELPNVDRVFVSAAVIPMGWVNAVGLFQHLHRRMGFCNPPQGANHPVEAEWRRDCPVPQGAVNPKEGPSEGWVQYYLDDFDCPAFVEKSIWEHFCGVMSTKHSKQRQAYQHVGVGISEDKAHIREPRVIRAGAQVDGVLGCFGPPREKTLETGWLAIWFLGQKKRGVKPPLMLLGRLVKCFEFRRPFMSLLDTCWPRNRFAPVLRVKTLAEIAYSVLRYGELL